MNKEPAFPSIKNRSKDVHTGMSLRDYIAAKAMQGFISLLDASRLSETQSGCIARNSYAVADAMLEARK
jgi:hypothetical protein